MFTILFNYLRFLNEASKPIASQEWHAGYKVAFKTPYSRLILFPGKRPRQEKCIVLFPPHAGKHPNIVDNLILTCQKEGFDTYAFEILSATWETRNVSLRNIVELGEACYAFPKQEKILMGVCQGLWASNLVAGNLTEDYPVAQFGFAGPVDFAAGNGYIKEMCQKIPYGYMQSVVVMNGGLQPGTAQWWNFALRNTKAIFWDDYEKLWKLITDGKDTTDWKRNHDWYWSSQNLAGPWFLESVKLFFMENKLKEMVDFRKFDWPLLLYAGEDDEITPPEQTFAMANMVSSRVIRKRLFKKCGHTATFCKKAPLDQVRMDLQLISDGFKENGNKTEPVAA